MNSGRRRISRLIESPWVYNWTKKKPGYITIDDDDYNCRPARIVSGGTLLRKKVSGSVFGKSQGEVSTPVPRLDIRNERMDADKMRVSVPDEEDDEFVTPREGFDSSGKKTAGRSDRRSGGSGFSAKPMQDLAENPTRDEVLTSTLYEHCVLHFICRTMKS
ncbi:hypothetical protein ACET3Z_031202 [Daucus carota]